mmetsp:Transcript_15716/g.22430  ORF Transcript_15716/g.22430 Transcript_15716/m.22430 type:complete len:95 (-) Transcript_15716:7272-7556(-)
MFNGFGRGSAANIKRTFAGYTRTPSPAIGMKGIEFRLNRVVGQHRPANVVTEVKDKDGEHENIHWSNDCRQHDGKEDRRSNPEKSSSPQKWPKP